MNQERMKWLYYKNMLICL